MARHIREGNAAMTRIRTYATATLISAGMIGHALAQAMNPAPPIRETGPAGSNSAASNAAATDFNWVWISLVIALATFAIWYAVRRKRTS